MSEHIKLTPERLRWARIHPAASHLADVIGNLAQREGWDDAEEIDVAIDRLIDEVDSSAERCRVAAAPRIDASGRVLPSWAMVSRLLAAWRDLSGDCRSAAGERATIEAYDACHLTTEGRMTGMPLP